MRNMKNKIIVIILAIVATIGIVFAINMTMPKKDVGNKTIYVTLIDETTNKTLLDKQSYKTDAETLGLFLDEENTDLVVVLTKYSFGRAIEVINGLKGDMNNPAGPWIIYTSSNNKACLAAGFCTGVDELPIYDKDEFVFKYTTKVN